MSYFDQGSSAFFSWWDILWWDCSFFLAVMRYPCELWCFAQFSCETSGWNVMLLGGPLRALRVRVRACLATVRCLDEMACFLAAEFSCWWCDVRTVERCMMKDAGDWVYTMVYWTLRGFEWVFRRQEKLMYVWWWWLVQVQVHWETEGFVWK